MNMLNTERWEYINDIYEGVISQLNEVADMLEDKEMNKKALNLAVEDFGGKVENFEGKIEDFLTVISGTEDEDETDIKLNDVANTLRGILSKVSDEIDEDELSSIDGALSQAYEKFKTALTVSEVTDTEVAKAIERASGDMIVAKNEVATQWQRVKSLANSIPEYEVRGMLARGVQNLEELQEYLQYNNGSRVAPQYVNKAKPEVEYLIDMLEDYRTQSVIIRDQIEVVKARILSLLEWYYSWGKN